MRPARERGWIKHLRGLATASCSLSGFHEYVPDPFGTYDTDSCPESSMDTGLASLISHVDCSSPVSMAVLLKDRRCLYRHLARCTPQRDIGWPLACMNPNMSGNPAKPLVFRENRQSKPFTSPACDGTRWWSRRYRGESTAGKSTAGTRQA